MKFAGYFPKCLRRNARTFVGGLCLVLFFGQSSPAQDATPDSLFVHDFKDTINVRLQWVYKGFNLRAIHRQQPGAWTYRPRYRPRVGLGGFLWNVGFNLLLPLPLNRASEDQRLRRFDFQGSLFARRWLLDGAFHRYRGFFVQRTGVPAPANAEVFRDELVTKKIQFSLTYLPGGNRVSLRAPFNQGNRQRKAAGSVLLSASGTYLTVRDPTDVIAVRPPELTEALLSRVRVYALSTKVGYTANLVYRSWFAHLFAMTGLDWQQTYYLRSGAQNAFTVEPNFDLRAGGGYDGGRWYGGIYGAFDYNQFRAGDWQFQGLSGQLRLFFGIRFGEPKWLQRRKPQFLEDLQNSPSIPLPPIFG